MRTEWATGKSRLVASKHRRQLIGFQFVGAEDTEDVRIAANQPPSRYRATASTLLTSRFVCGVDVDAALRSTSTAKSWISGKLRFLT